MSEHYTTPPKPRRRIPIWVWVVGGLLIGSALLGSCVMGGVKVFKSLGERGIASKILAEKVMVEGLPDSSDPIWGADITKIDDLEAFDENVSKTSRYYRKFGPVETIGESSCNAKTSAGIGQANGTFMTCSMPMVAEKSPGMITVTWKRYDGEWKLYYFNVQFSDISALIDDEVDADSADPTD